MIIELGDSFTGQVLGRLDVLVGAWLVAVNSCDDGVFTCLLTVHHHRKLTSFWYKKQPLGVTLLNQIMKELADNGRIQGKKMNHSARKTMIQTLCSANVLDFTIMQLSGHKSITSLNHYKKPSLDQQRSMSNLSTLQADPSPCCSLSVSKQKTNLNSNQLCSTPGVLSNATFNRLTAR